MGQPVICRNVPGAGSILGTSLGAKAAPDDDTIALVASTSRGRRRRVRRKLLARSGRPGWYVQTRTVQTRRRSEPRLRDSATRQRLLTHGVETQGAQMTAPITVEDAATPGG